MVFDGFEPLIESGAGCSRLGEEQGFRYQVFARECGSRRERGFGRKQHSNLVGVNPDHLKLLVAGGQLRDPEVGEVVEDCSYNLHAVGTIDVKLNVWKQVFEVGEDCRKDVDTGSFVGGDDDFTSRN